MFTTLILMTSFIIVQTESRPPNTDNFNIVAANNISFGVGWRQATIDDVSEYMSEVEEIFQRHKIGTSDVKLLDGYVLNGDVKELVNAFNKCPQKLTRDRWTPTCKHKLIIRGTYSCEFRMGWTPRMGGGVKIPGVTDPSVCVSQCVGRNFIGVSLKEVEDNVGVKTLQCYCSNKLVYKSSLITNTQGCYRITTQQAPISVTS